MSYLLDTDIISAFQKKSIPPKMAAFTESFVPLDLDVLIWWRQLLSELKSVNRTLTCEDSLLAATCLANDFVMATNNVRHFEPARQFGLEIENPLA